MTKISSKWTLFYKRIFPIFWFGLIAVFLILAIFGGRNKPNPVPMQYVVPAFMLVVGFFLMKKLVWDLVDEVYDCGDSLLVKNRDTEERINLSNVMNVNVSSSTNPPRITLRLVKPCRLGNEIAFSPERQGFSLNPFAKNKIGEDLIVRVDRARVKRAI